MRKLGLVVCGMAVCALVETTAGGVALGQGDSISAAPTDVVNCTAAVLCIDDAGASPFKGVDWSVGPTFLSQAPATPPEEPEHTGVVALVRTTASDFAAFPRRRSTWVILGIGAGAAAIVYAFDDDLQEQLQDADTLRKVFAPGKYVGYGWVQASAATGIYLIGRFMIEPEDGSRTNKVSHLGFDLLRATILTQVFTVGIKYAVQRDRPTGECCAFPSGHASVTFATAAVLERHFGYRASWPMFAVAGYVAASRLTDNRHYLSDVLFGAALGMASGWTVVGRHGRETFSAYPVVIRGGVALSGSYTPKSWN